MGCSGDIMKDDRSLNGLMTVLCTVFLLFLVQLFIQIRKLPHLKRLDEIIEKVVEKNVNPPIYFEMWSKKYEIRQYN
jgi:hypothetical protein